MKRVILLILSLPLLLNFKSMSIDDHYDLYYKKQLIGQWLIQACYKGKKEININQKPYCENKEMIEFSDSIMKQENYRYFKNRCFKDITTKNYEVRYEYSATKKLSAYYIVEKHAPYFNGAIILELNDSILKLEDQQNKVTKTYKRIR